jgi:dinuclear metal center YbgI/SA1388 family protein
MSVSLSLTIAELERRVPLQLAESWDKVGLLVEPGSPLGERAPERQLETALLTIDLTSEVLTEAVELGAGLIIAYHPPLFRPIERLDWRNPQGRLLIELVRRGIAVWSPHTALDAVVGGVNDWLADAVGPGTREPIVPSSERAELKLVVFVPHDAADRLRDALAGVGAGVIGEYSHCSFNLEGRGTFLGSEATHPTVGKAGRFEIVDEVRLEMVCPPRLLPLVAETLRREHPYEEPAWEAYPLERRPIPGAGMGRLVTLAEPASLEQLLSRLKSHLGLPQVRLAQAPAHAAGKPLRRIALCAGAGGSLFEKVGPVDLLITGEMRHHDVLGRVQGQTSVILCEHTNTERGFLPQLAQSVQGWVVGLRCQVSGVDRDPLRIV